MPISTRYRCRNCGEKFAAEVLTEDEVREARRRHQGTSSIHCPKCNRTDLEKDR